MDKQSAFFRYIKNLKIKGIEVVVSTKYVSFDDSSKNHWYVYIKYIQGVKNKELNYNARDEDINVCYEKLHLLLGNYFKDIKISNSNDSLKGKDSASSSDEEKEEFYDVEESQVSISNNNNKHKPAPKKTLKIIENHDESCVKETSYKTALNNYYMSIRKKMPEYRLFCSNGPDHLKKFKSVLVSDDERINNLVSGEFGTKKESELCLAKHAWEILNAAGAFNVKQ
jgi:hypothetical protein